MATCERYKPGNRGIVKYKRHKYKAGICKFCGAQQTEQLRALANRRTKRLAARRAARSVA